MSRACIGALVEAKDLDLEVAVPGLTDPFSMVATDDGFSGVGADNHILSGIVVRDELPPLSIVSRGWVKAGVPKPSISRGIERDAFAAY
ncbi:hypothetical protein BOTNAR_0108g00250 [Botryotinia narcissicola]|uniref:Uncharacterized protein n=1 Tax=Botryotinia narcissicola TaxID=278944 RepID=A0A4Z1IQD6_9HELO|nr:hypothetical protein BOTNAR_0108g00250 [Botryotinia narcissicola]